MATQKYIQQGFQSIREIKLFHSQRYFVDKLRKTLESLQRQNLFLYAVPYYPRLFLEFIFVILVFVLISVLIYLNFSSIKILTILGGFAAISFRIFPSFNRMINAFQMIRNHKHLLDIILTALENKETDEKILEIHPAKRVENNISIPSKNFISVNNVTFKYNTNSKNIFNNFNLRIQKNEFICVVGKSGCGKSTLIDIISGLIKPDEGEVLVDEQYIYKNKKLIDLWQERISFVPQNIFLFNDTISQNIALSDIDNHRIDENRLQQLIKDFELHDFIKSLDLGLDTIINESVLNISGGQRQRIAIARAFYKNTDIIIMDEPTNSLDKITEKKIFSKIIQNRANKTIILITHNEDIAKYTDRVVRIE
jgi:ATP-binding cassette subfamily C protein